MFLIDLRSDGLFCNIRRNTNGHLGHVTEMIPSLADINGQSGHIIWRPTDIQENCSFLGKQDPEEVEWKNNPQEENAVQLDVIFLNACETTWSKVSVIGMSRSYPSKWILTVTAWWCWWCRGCGRDSQQGHLRVLGFVTSVIQEGKVPGVSLDLALAAVSAAAVVDGHANAAARLGTCGATFVSACLMETVCSVSRRPMVKHARPMHHPEYWTSCVGNDRTESFGRSHTHHKDNAHENGRTFASPYKRCRRTTEK